MLIAGMRVLREAEAVVEEVGITEAAQRLGVSDDTIRRRIRVGQLEGRREKTPRGYRWVVQVPPYPVNDQAIQTTELEALRKEIADLREFLALAREELVARRKEVDQLIEIVRNSTQDRG